MVDNLYAYKLADQRLALGMNVIACWTESGFCYRGQAVVVKLNRICVTVRLLHVIGRKTERPVEKQIELPRFTDQTRWSQRNCVWPVEQKPLKAQY